jgi:threonine dehydrogenase-like Zn-dependent dehydrogenase
MADAIARLKRSGVLCIVGIDGRDQRIELDGRELGLEFVLKNGVVVGSVNAQRQDWLAGVDALARMDPELLRGLIGLRVPLDRFEEAFASRGGKATLVIADE